MMQKKQQRNQRQKFTRYKIFCEGDTEKWFFDKILNAKFFDIEKAKHSNVTYFESNTPEQLTKASVDIRKLHPKLLRVFSNHSFETVFYCNFSSISKPFINIQEINNILKILYKIDDYKKDKKTIEHIADKASVENICKNSRNMHNELIVQEQHLSNVPDDIYYHNTDYYYTEIYKILEFSVSLQFKNE